MLKFLMIARVLYDKGYKEYVEAAQIIHKTSPNTKFLLLGKIDKEYPNCVPEEIVKQDCQNGSIEYLGFSDEVISIIKEADCIVLPSYHEGMSRVLMESLAIGKPIITTNIPGCKETVKENVNGYLVKVKDAQSLSNAINKFISLNEHERKIMGDNSRNLAKEKFSINKVIEIYKSITSSYLIE